jgi:hypothetical protein
MPRGTRCHAAFRVACRLIIDPATYQAHPGYTVGHSGQGLPIECYDIHGGSVRFCADPLSIYILPEENLGP